jgi:hypothetical protein
VSYWWIAFWLIEGAIAVYLISQHFSNKRPTSMDVAMGDEIGNLILVAFGILLSVVAFTIFAWQHFRFSP